MSLLLVGTTVKLLRYTHLNLRRALLTQAIQLLPKKDFHYVCCLGGFSSILVLDFKEKTSYNALENTRNTRDLFHPSNCAITLINSVTRVLA